MRIAYFDCPSGASGDMVLGALVDAGCQVGELETALASLKVDGWHLEATAVERGGLHGTHLVVRTDPARRFRHPRRHARAHRALDPVRRREDARGVPCSGGWPRPRRACTGSRSTRCTSTRWATSTRSSTWWDRWPASTRSAWSGCTSRRSRSAAAPSRRRTDGSRFPRPRRPSCCAGSPCTTTGSPSELVTPTGAAILTTLGTPDRLPAMTLERIGWGAGTRELPVPNLLRVLVGQTAARGLRARRGRDPGQHRDDHRRHVAPALRAARRAAPGGRRARRVSRPRRHEAEPARDRALGARGARARGSARRRAVPRDDDDRGTLERGPPPPASAGAGPRSRRRGERSPSRSRGSAAAS